MASTFRTRRFPLAPVRDLLGIVRVLYRGEQANPEADERTLAALQQIGVELGRALDLGKNEPDTMGFRAAWNWVDQATFKLNELVAERSMVAAINATLARIKRVQD
jgi:hypothetical protein